MFDDFQKNIMKILILCLFGFIPINSNKLSCGPAVILDKLKQKVK